MISVSELLSNTLYPSAKGANLLKAFSSTGPPVFAFVADEALSQLDSEHNRDGSLAADEIPQITGAPLRHLLAYADRNADSLLSTEELNIWLQLLHDLTQA